ncbi:MAG TPA: response regulator [Terriglobales bacterium]|nr:response regulator [Terriglobales bacterium]
MRARILCVSCAASLLEARRLTLEEEGHFVELAKGLIEALEQLRSGSHFDLIILDHSLPSKDREAIVAEIRQRCTTPILSLQSDREPLLERIEGVQVGFVGSVPPVVDPVGRRRFILAIRTMLERKS